MLFLTTIYHTHFISIDVACFKENFMSVTLKKQVSANLYEMSVINMSVKNKFFGWSDGYT